MSAGPDSRVGAQQPDRFDRVPSNALAVFTARVVAAIALTALVAIAAHQLDTADFGLVVSTMAAGFIVNTVITFGTDTLITRSVAAGDSDAAELTRASLRLQLTAATVVATAGVITFAAGAPAVVAIEALTMLPLAVVTVASAVIRGVERMHHLFTASTAGALVSLVVVLVGFSIEVNPVVPIGARAIGNVVVAVVIWRAAARHFDWRGGRLALAPLARRAAPFAAMVVLAAIGTQAGVLLVEFLGDEPTGGYGAALRLFEAARMVPAAVVAAFFPAMVGGLHRSPRFPRWRSGLVGYTIAATIALLIAAGLIDRWIFDSQPSGPTLSRIVALALPLTVARLLLSFEAIADKRENIVVASAAAGTIVLLAVGAALVSSLGATAVAAAQVAGVAAAVAVLVVARARSATKEPAA